MTKNRWTDFLGLPYNIPCNNQIFSRMTNFFSITIWMVEIESFLITWLNFLKQCPITIWAMIEMFQTKHANFQLPNLETKFFWCPLWWPKVAIANFLSPSLMMEKLGDWKFSTARILLTKTIWLPKGMVNVHPNKWNEHN